jgi:serine protease
MSLGGSGPCGNTQKNAINTAVANGTTVVVAAGNDSDLASNHNPANCANVIAVGAVDRTGGMASYSNYGSTVDISAPGGGSGNPIYSTLNAGTSAPGAESYAGYNGTSMATPHVAGVVALVRSAGGSTLTPAQMEQLLKVTARTQPVPCYLGCGAGPLDAANAVTASGTPVLSITDPQDQYDVKSGT